MAVIPTLEQLKLQARTLRKNLSGEHAISHSKSLEMVAHRYGFRNWNVITTKAPKYVDIRPMTVGSVVEGQYLGQTFTGTVKAVSNFGGNGHVKVSIKLDKPVDVVRFDSFSSFRKRISCVIDTRAISPQSTSDGTPYLILSRIRPSCEVSGNWDAYCV